MLSRFEFFIIRGRPFVFSGGERGIFKGLKLEKKNQTK